MNVHTFANSPEAYDACQCDEAIKDGDVLLIESEGVVGVAGTWPVAVTAEHGRLHGFTLGASLERWLDSCTHGDAALRQTKADGVKEAVELAKLKEYPLNALFN